MSGVGEGHEQQGGELASEDTFDRRGSDILATRRTAARTCRAVDCERIDIDRAPAGMVTARLRGPVWRYHGGGPDIGGLG
jgi:hypothetical protein